jgi:hypothetical protein
MKYLFRKPGTIVLSGLLALTAISCSKDNVSIPVTKDNSEIVTDINTANFQNQLNAFPKEALSQEEINSLVYMREEEKMARDVYQTLYKKWKLNILNNISSAEQTHMDAILNLLNKYNIKDPVGSNGIGVFTNATIANLYNSLVSKGSLTKLEGLKSGALIEEVDIFDLRNAATFINNQDIRFVYSNLAKASQTHLRAFYRNILTAGGTYTPVYLSIADFNAIINGQADPGF